MLLIKADNHLGLDSAVAQPGNDRLLNFRYGSRSGGNLAGIRNINAALLINGLRRQIDEVAGACARGLSGREQTAGRGFKDRYVENVADPDDLIRLGAFIGEFALERNQIGLRQKADRVGAHVDQRVRKCCAGPHASRRIVLYGVAFRPRSWKQRASRQHRGDNNRK